MGEHATGERRRVSGARPLFHEEDVPELLGRIENIIRGGRLIFGENTREFEESFREYVGTRHAVTVNSWKPEECPLCKAGGKAIKPGSRPKQA